MAPHVNAAAAFIYLFSQPTISLTFFQRYAPAIAGAANGASPPTTGTFAPRFATDVLIKPPP